MKHQDGEHRDQAAVDEPGHDQQPADPPSDEVYTEEELDAVTARLRELGYA
ncbi:MAG: hypothetical protein HOV94_26610 [Saccharothrix sp.]|nr:hypothetical protein [Saccharothrix sp.]